VGEAGCADTITCCVMLAALQAQCITGATYCSKHCSQCCLISAPARCDVAAVTRMVCQQASEHSHRSADHSRRWCGASPGVRILLKCLEPLFTGKMQSWHATTLVFLLTCTLHVMSKLHACVVSGSWSRVLNTACDAVTQPLAQQCNAATCALWHLNEGVGTLSCCCWDSRWAAAACCCCRVTAAAAASAPVKT
jgi:hypothetical protein